jgi:hypothetical protein
MPHGGTSITNPYPPPPLNKNFNRNRLRGPERADGGNILFTGVSGIFSGKYAKMGILVEAVDMPSAYVSVRGGI